ncbi:DUF5703 domain-containing protein [Chitinophaga tropicalis]|uniref:DUF5703 domain-containing protein n=1 Tax=Chitinophaga tropicalis TaxID=2683588 RepID=A0A7K1U6I1_9BACT|nr:DUF5703 domain-containing protein [Chitinophaga tropicalis]MVT09968.1 hypothetical protein [Chitinophaga tropicalis]
MKHCYLLLFFLLITIYHLPAQHIYTWNTQSHHAGESMPCGGGDIGLNAWVENGDILFYLSRSGTFDENNAMLKLGRIRLQFPFSNKHFKQELRLEEGGIRISTESMQVNLWVDVFNPLVHVEIKSTTPVSIKAAYESWRYEDHLVKDAREFRTNSYKKQPSFNVKTFKDSISFKEEQVLFWHRNKGEDVFDYTVHREGMDSVKEQLYNPIKNNTFGGAMYGAGMLPAGTDSGIYADTKYQAWVLQSRKAVKTQHITIALHVGQTASLNEWTNGLNALTKLTSNKQRTQQWWKQFFERSYISINSKDTVVKAISRNYELFRYMLGCNAYGKWPTKFNGGLFTFDPRYVDEKSPYSPDFRLWGGGTMTAQNQRLVYFPMLKSGDIDMMRSQFDFYMRAWKNAELRSKVYWKHNGACFTEQLENFGLPNIMEYGPDRPAGTDPGVEYNAWLEYQWETVFEFCLMMLETERYGGKDISEYLPFIESCLTFYDEHYRQLAARRSARTLDSAGHYILYPTSSAETFKVTYNSTTVISALKVITERMLELPLDTAQRRRIAGIQQKIPPIPLRQIDGHTVLAPAETWARVQNTETPQLYPVFPWGIYGVGKPGLDTALNTWKYDPHAVKYRSHVGWRQYSIFAARLGLTADAAALTAEKFKDGPHRFPAFWGPAFDWTPDHNWGGSAMIGLQEMLMQVDGRKIYLLPAWPDNWNVSFKLHAPYNTFVEGVVKDGKIETLQVTPASRRQDVIIKP